MASHKTKTVVDSLPGYIILYSDGSHERLKMASVPLRPSPGDGAVATADVRIDAVNGVWARIFMPPLTTIFEEKEQQQLTPVVLHFHGGSFCIGSPSAPLFHNFCEKMAGLSGCIWISLDYRLAPEHPLPAAYDDAFTAVRWLHSQARNRGEKDYGRPDHHHHRKNEKGENGFTLAAETLGVGEVEDSLPNPKTLNLATETGDPDSKSQFASEALGLRWLERHADFSKLFLAGESSGGTMVHFTAATASGCDLQPLRIRGLVFIHPSFLQGDPRPEDACTTSPCLQSLSRMRFYHRYCMPHGAPWSHPLKNPLHADATPKLSEIDLPPALVMVAGIDILRPGALAYYQALKQAGKDAQLFVSQDVGHCFHMCTPEPSLKVQEFEARLIEFLHSF